MGKCGEDEGKREGKGMMWQAVFNEGREQTVLRNLNDGGKVYCVGCFSLGLLDQMRRLV